MYESPITVHTQLNDVLEEVHKKQEEYVYNYIFKIGVDVNKEELIRALQYDREQYTKGYRDGIQEFVERLKERLRYCCSIIGDSAIVYEKDIDKLVKEMLPAEKLATESDARDIENYEIAHRVRTETINEFVEKLKQCGRYPQCRPFPDNPVLNQNRIWLEEDIDSLVNYELSKMTE